MYVKMSTQNEEKMSHKEKSDLYKGALVLVLIGAVNWGTAAIVGKDVVSVLFEWIAEKFEQKEWGGYAARVVFALVAIAGIIVTSSVSSNGF